MECLHLKIYKTLSKVCYRNKILSKLIIQISKIIKQGRNTEKAPFLQLRHMGLA